MEQSAGSQDGSGRTLAAVQWPGLAANLRLLPNQITALRLLATPLMWWYALRGQLVHLGLGFTICLVSDLLDGFAARRLDQCTDFGAKFDSLSDQLLQISALLWILLLMPEIYRENRTLFLLAVITYLASLVVGLVKFGRVANLHLYLSKFGGLFLYLFLIHAFLAGAYSQLLCILAGVLFVLSSAETLLLQLTSSEVNSGMGSIFFRYIREDHPIRIWLSKLP
jgi:cardiolipin synthase